MSLLFILKEIPLQVTFEVGALVGLLSALILLAAAGFVVRSVRSHRKNDAHQGARRSPELEPLV